MHKNYLAKIIRHQNRLLIGIGIILILSAFVPRLWLLQTRFFDRDELEHLHTAWLSFEGHVLYRDFFLTKGASFAGKPEAPASDF